MLGPVVSLFDLSGNMVKPWAFHGFTCYCFDNAQKQERSEHYESGGIIHYINMDLNSNAELLWIICKLHPRIVFGFPPCTHLAVSGAGHFYKKLLENVNFQDDAVDLCRIVELVGDCCDCPWMLENPLSRLSTLWRTPDYYFHPRDYGGYLNDDDIHPTYPEYIPPRDAYTKLTALWHGNGFVLPPKKPVPALIKVSENGITGSLAFHKLGGKGERTKRIRAETPRGLAWGVYEANRHAIDLARQGKMPVNLDFKPASQRRQKSG